MLADIQCLSESADWRSLQAFDGDGDELWAVENVAYIDDYYLMGDSGIWTLELDYGCDYIGAGYQLRRYNNVGVLEYSFESDASVDDPVNGLDFAWIGNQIVAINDSIIAISSAAGISLFNTETSSFFDLIPTLPEWSPALELVRIGLNRAVAHTGDILFCFDHEGNDLWAQAATQNERIVERDFYMIHQKPDELVLLNSAGGLADSWDNTLSVDIEQVFVSGGKVYALGHNFPGDEVAILDEDFDLLTSWTADQSDLFFSNAIINMEDQLVMGGRNGHHGTALAVLKAYGEDGSTGSYEQDIEVSAIHIDSVGMYVVNQEFEVYQEVAYDVIIEVTNNGDDTVDEFSLYIDEYPLVQFCSGPSVASDQLVESIAPGATLEIIIPQVYGESIVGPEEGEVLEFEVCAWTHGPNRRIDSEPDNDDLCEITDWIFTDLRESEDQIELYYRPVSNEIFIGGNLFMNWALTDAGGKTIATGIRHSGESTISLPALRQGIYQFTSWNEKIREQLRFGIF